MRKTLMTWALSFGVFGAVSLQAQDELRWRGDVTATRAVFQDIADLHKQKTGTSFVAEISSTDDAIQAVTDGSADLCGVARAPDQDSSADLRASLVPVAWDAVAAVVHSENQARAVSVRQLAGIFQGSNTDWAAYGGSGAIEPLILADDRDGVVRSAKRLLVRGANTDMRAARKVDDLAALEQALIDQPGAIALVSYALARRMKVRILAVEGRSPSPESVATGDYLLFYPIYFGRSDSTDKRRQVQLFLRFAQSPDARRLIRRNGMVPYTEALTLVSKQVERDQILDRLLGN